MYLSNVLLCINLLAAFSQIQAQPLRHHLSLHTTHQHHMHLHHHLSASKLTSSEELEHKIISHVPQNVPLPSPHEPSLRHDAGAGFHTLPQHDDHLAVGDHGHTGELQR